MKKIKTLVLGLIAITLCVSYDNDSNPSPNDVSCNYQGLSFLDNSNNTQTLIPEINLRTHLRTNPPSGIPTVEISTAVGGGFPIVEFRTEAITLGATESTLIGVDGTFYPVTVTCQRAGNIIGDEFRFDIVGGGVEAEFCVIIDAVIIYYEDLDFDGFGSQTLATPTSANFSFNSDDCDDTDSTIKPGATEVLNDGIDSNCDGNDNT